jgi:transcriptional regulator with XRE-family HTH domain
MFTVHGKNTTANGRITQGFTLTRWDTTTFGGRLAEAATAVGYANANQLAEALGLSATGPNRWWKNEARPDADNLEKIVRLLRVSAHWLLIGERESESERMIAAIRQILMTPAGSASPTDATAQPAGADGLDPLERRALDAVRESEKAPPQRKKRA